MNEPNPEAQLSATREAIENWLSLNGAYWDGDQTLIANNLTLWAISFLRLSQDDVRLAENRTKRDGAREALTRIQEVAGRASARAPEIDYDHLLATAFLMEMTRLSEQP